MEIKRNPLLDTLTEEEKKLLPTIKLFMPRISEGGFLHTIELYDDTKKYEEPYALLNLSYWGLCIEIVRPKHLK
jgi:hypothetical protein